MKPDNPERDWIAARRGADFVVLARFASASNAALLVALQMEDPAAFEDAELRALVNNPNDPRTRQLAVFKPKLGEAPLNDFPDGTLHRREVAAFEVSDLFDWQLVPATMLADHETLGVGSLQRFVPHDADRHYFHLREVAAQAVVRQLQTMIVFDAIINNADRKSGHVLLEALPRVEDMTRAATGAVVGSLELDASQRIRLVDHGLAFNVDDKLRTVAWDHAGQPFPRWLHDTLAAVAARHDELAAVLTDLVTVQEARRVVERMELLVERGRFPEPFGPRPIPWPPV